MCAYLNPSQKHQSQTIFSFVGSQLKVTLPCPALQEVIRKDGTFDIMYWKVCTSRRCDHKDTTWDWIAGMSNTGITKVGRERVNITRDGALEIHRVNISDTGQYMCGVKKIDHSSPGIYHTTLVVIKDGKFKSCFGLLVGLSIKLFASGCSNTGRSGGARLFESRLALTHD